MLIGVTISSFPSFFFVQFSLVFDPLPQPVSLSHIEFFRRDITVLRSLGKEWTGWGALRAQLAVPTSQFSSTLCLVAWW